MTRVERAQAQCEKYGEALTVTRRATTQGGTATTQSVYFIVKPLTVGNSMPVTMEGNLSGAEDNAIIFSCAGDQDVREVVDSITYRSSSYRLANVNPRPWGGVDIWKHCTGVRES